MRTVLWVLLCLPGLALAAQEVDMIVYPGDAGNDSLCSARDLLPIGIAWNRETFPREPQDSVWAPQLAVGLELNILPQTGVNIAHVDANGDGFIDFNDARVVAMNYDSIVSESVPLPPAYQPPFAVPTTLCPYLRLTFDRDTAMVLDTFYLDIFVEGFPGELPEPDGILGVSFSLSYDPIFLRDTLTRVLPDTLPGDLMFVHATQNLAYASRGLGAGRIDFAAAGRGQNVIRDNRFLGRVEFIVEDMIFRNTAEFVLDVNIDEASILFVNRDEFFFSQPDCVNEADEVLLLDPATATRAPSAAPTWRLFPNPAGTACRIEGERLPEQAWLYNMLGQPIREVDPRQPIALAELPAGLYFLRVRSGGEEAVFQLLHQ
ncbi:MAG: T9SS type A sorting domain-containing protein [Lewinella sp.]|nr:T9SS type A sorting domain-containing protein [Lewinella sp.]